jgi:hypothetical protein
VRRRLHDHRQGSLRLRAARARQGTCSNSRGVRRQELERRILNGLRSSLVTPDLVAEFISEYQSEWNRLASQHRIASLHRERKLGEVRRKIDGLLGALERGIITPTTKERLLALEAEQQALQSVPADPPIPAIHPNLARLYREKVRRIEAELADPEIAAEAKSVLRSMIRRIVVFPGDGREEVTLELHGELATILAVAQGTKNKAGNPVSRIQVSVVAGARSHLYRTDIRLDRPAARARDRCRRRGTIAGPEL